MLNRIILAIIIAIIAYLACLFGGSYLVTINTALAVTMGNLLRTFSVLIGLVVFTVLIDKRNN